VKKLVQVKVNVIVVPDSISPVKPDSVFPNNWFTTGKNGEIFIFPMKPANRRLERENPVLEYLKKNGYQINRVVDLSHYEKECKYLEGTGSMVFDHQNSIAYACKSERTNEEVFNKFC
jgi:hypothetical protein